METVTDIECIVGTKLSYIGLKGNYMRIWDDEEHEFVKGI